MKKQVGIISFILNIFIWAGALEVILLFIGLAPALHMGLNVIYVAIIYLVILAISIGVASFNATNKYELPDNLRNISIFFVLFVLFVELVLLAMSFPKFFVLTLMNPDFSYRTFLISLLGYALVKGPFVYFFLYLFKRKEKLVS
ncbi:MAG: hypothetical protein V3574_01220 [Candidatus Moraniibacteriota bacterium]